MKVAFHTLGCKVNTYESEALRQMFEDEGYVTVPFEEKADVYVINTCSVTAVADKKSRQMIHRAKRLNPGARVIATGCFVHGMSEEEKRELDIDAVYDNDKKNDLIRDIKVRKMEDRARANVKIEDGCNSFCTYCIIPYKRGRIKNRPKGDIVEEVRLLSASGHKEIVLTGIHITHYGSEALTDLIKEIAELEGIERIRLGSLEPGIITDEFLSSMKDIEKFCPHFHLSLQSGCDKTLKAMNRHYTTDEFRTAVHLIRQYFEHPAITCDVIVGFPGESEDDFRESRDFCDEMRFFHMHIFPYSRRTGTVADKMPGQLTQKVKQERVKILEDIDRKNSAEFMQYYIGREVEILTEEKEMICGQEYMVGHTKTYVRVAAGGKENFRNQIVKLKVSGLEDNTLF